MSAKDLVTLATHLIRDFPEYYPYFAEDSFEWAEIVQANRNPLLQMDIGADGLKTGHTEEAGYGLVGSAMQDGRRVVYVIMGLGSTSERAQEGERVVSWAFREFTKETLFSKNQVISVADVWLGAADNVGLVPDGGVKCPINMGLSFPLKGLMALANQHKQNFWPRILRAKATTFC